MKFNLSFITIDKAQQFPRQSNIQTSEMVHLMSKTINVLSLSVSWWPPKNHTSKDQLSLFMKLLTQTHKI